MKRYLRIVLKQVPTLWYDMEMAADTPLNHYVAQIQMSGYILTPTFFVPYDQIAHMCILEVGGSAPMDFTKARGLQ